MAINKVVYDGETLIDITDSTVTSYALLSGVVAYGADGEQIIGEVNTITEEEIKNISRRLSDDEDEMNVVAGQEWGDGAWLALRKRDREDRGGSFELFAFNEEGDEWTSLYGDCNEGLKWGDKYVAMADDIPSWAKEATKPTYTAEEVGAVPIKTWSLKGTITDAGSITIDLTGCTEMYIKGYINPLATCQIAMNGYVLIDSIPANTLRTYCAKFVDGFYGLENVYCRYSNNTKSPVGVSTVGYERTLLNGRKISAMTSLEVKCSSGVTECNIEVYAR